MARATPTSPRVRSRSSAGAPGACQTALRHCGSCDGSSRSTSRRSPTRRSSRAVDGEPDRPYPEQLRRVLADAARPDRRPERLPAAALPPPGRGLPARGRRGRRGRPGHRRRRPGPTGAAPRRSSSSGSGSGSRAPRSSPSTGRGSTSRCWSCARSSTACPTPAWFAPARRPSGARPPRPEGAARPRAPAPRRRSTSTRSWSGCPARRTSPARTCRRSTRPARSIASPRTA